MKVGLGYRDEFRDGIFAHREEIDLLEVTVEHFLDAPPERIEVLELLRRHFTLIPHGLNLSLGSAEGIDSAYVDSVAALVEEIHPPYWSEHIAFSRAGGVDIGHLAPLPLTSEALDMLARNYRKVRGRLPVPLILENITCAFLLPGAEMSEPEFLRRLVAETGCGLLLDVTNLFTNSVNHGFSWRRWMDEAPMEAVRQFHFAGGHWHGGVLIDSHSRPAPPEVFEMLAEAAARCQPFGAILERDEHLPPFPEILAELRRAREALHHAGGVR